MVILRHFSENDCPVLMRHQYMDMSENDVRKTIMEWNTTVFNGVYFEMFAIVDESERIVGQISIYQHSDTVASIGPTVFPEYRRNGFAAQAMSLMLEIAKEKGYKIILQQIRTGNTASLSLHKKLGYETDNYVYINKKGNEVLLYLKSVT